MQELCKRCGRIIKKGILLRKDKAYKVCHNCLTASEIEEFKQLIMRQRGIKDVVKI